MKRNEIPERVKGIAEYFSITTEDIWVRFNKDCNEITFTIRNCFVAPILNHEILHQKDLIYMDIGVIESANSLKIEFTHKLEID